MEANPVTIEVIDGPDVGLVEDIYVYLLPHRSRHSPLP